MSSAPVFLKANYADLYGSAMLPALEELYRQELAQHPSRRDLLFKKVKTEQDIWQASEVHDMPLFSEVSEGEDYSYNRPRAGANKTFVPLKYGLGFSISEEAVEDGKFDMISDAVRKMAKSARESQEIAAMNIFNNGFSAETAMDGVAVFSTAHTLPSGLTFRNRLSTDADLSVSSLDTMLSDFETQFVGDTGIYELIKPKVLLVHSSQRRYALELIGSDLKADTADNNMNSLKQEGLIVVSSPHLTDTDAWYMLADKSDTGLRIVSRKEVETKYAGADAGFDNDSIKVKSRYREKIGVTSAKGIFGTSGG
jgi:hypothetical protein